MPLFESTLLGYLLTPVEIAVIPKHIPATEIIAGVESSIRKLDSENNDSVRREAKTKPTKVQHHHWTTLGTKIT